MRQGALGMASLLVLALLAGCTAGTKDTHVSEAATTLPTSCPDAMPGMDMCSVASGAGSGAGAGGSGFAPTTKVPVTLTVSGAAWVAPGTVLDASVTPPADMSGPVSYVWAYGPMGGTVPITTMSKTKTDLILPGKSESITFDAAGVFYEHCHPHPWMRSNVTILDNGQPPVTATVHFIDGATPDTFHFTPENLVLPKGSTVVYQNDGTQPHQTMLMQQDAPLAPLPLTGTSGQVTANGAGWQRVVVYAMDANGHFGVAEHDVYVDPLPQPLTLHFTGGYNHTVPSAIPAPAPDPAAEGPWSFAFNAERSGTLALNWTAQDPLAANSAPADPAPASIQIDITSKDGSEKIGPSKAADKGVLEGALKGGDHTIKVTPVDGEAVAYSITLTIVYDLVPPPANPYSDPSTQVSMTGSSNNGGGMNGMPM